MIWTSGTIRWLNKWIIRWPRAKAIGGIPSWENLSTGKLITEMIRETVWKRFEESGRVCKASIAYNSTDDAKRPLPQFSMSLPLLHMLGGLITMIHLRTCAFPTSPRLTHIMQALH